MTTNQAEIKNLLDDMILSLEKELSDCKRILGLMNETKVNLETKIARLNTMRLEASSK
jgi:hypothetical protein